MSENSPKPRKKSEVRKRQNVKSFRLSDEELAGFEKNCINDNLSPTDYFRVHCCAAQALRKHNFVRPDEKKLSAILSHLGKYGSNLNQIAHVLNIAKLEPSFSTSYAVNRLHEYQKQIEELQSVILECRTLVRETLLGHDLNG